MSEPPPCESRVCSSKSDKMKSMFASMDGKRTGAAAAAAGAALASAETAAAPCPPDRDELGLHTWTLLHATAANYPEQPSPAHRTAATALISSLARLYPCSDCRDDFVQTIEASPPRVGSREEFCVWMCQQHNLVNEKTGKPSFPCEIAKLDARWRDGGERCNDSPHDGGGSDAAAPAVPTAATAPSSAL